MRLEKKDLLLLIPATLLAIAGLGPDDPWVVGPCLFLSWVSFIALCIYHDGRRKTRILVGIGITLALSGVGYRRFNAILENPYDPRTLHSMSNDRLKDATKRLTDDLHDLENDIMVKDQELNVKFAVEGRSKTSLEEFEKRVRLWRAALNNLNSEYVNSFQKTYLRSICDTREELLWRAHKTPEEMNETMLPKLCRGENIEWLR